MEEEEAEEEEEEEEEEGEEGEGEEEKEVEEEEEAEQVDGREGGSGETINYYILSLMYYHTLHCHLFVIFMMLAPSLDLADQPKSL